MISRVISERSHGWCYYAGAGTQHGCRIPLSTTVNMTLLFWVQECNARMNLYYSTDAAGTMATFPWARNLVPFSNVVVSTGDRSITSQGITTTLSLSFWGYRPVKSPATGLWVQGEFLSIFH
jgi:hypothetical protein